MKYLYPILLLVSLICVIATLTYVQSKVSRASNEYAKYLIEQGY